MGQHFYEINYRGCFCGVRNIFYKKLIEYRIQIVRIPTLLPNFYYLLTEIFIGVLNILDEFGSQGYDKGVFDHWFIYTQLIVNRSSQKRYELQTLNWVWRKSRAESFLSRSVSSFVCSSVCQ